MLDKSYQFKNLIIRSYQGVKYLSKAKDASFQSIEDIGKVAEDDLPENEELTDAQVIGVKKLDSYFSCLSCSSKIEPMDDKLGRCLKCNMQQVLHRCKKLLNATLVISSGDSYLTLNAFGSIVNDIAEKKDVTAEALLSSRSFTLTYDLNVIATVKRP